MVMDKLSRVINIKKLIENMDVGIILLDHNLNFLLINTEAANLLNLKNYTLEKHIELDSINDMKQVKSILNQICENPTNFKSKILINPSNCPYQFLITSILNDLNKIDYIAITIKSNLHQIYPDFTRRQLIRSISHELRAPLLNIQSFLETLIEYYDRLSEKEKKEFLTIANQETLRLSRLVDNILNSFKLNSNYYDFNTVDIALLADQVIQSYQIKAQDKDVNILLEIDKVFYIKGNYDLLFQVFSNLIDNSLKFAKYLSQIIIRIYLYCPANNFSGNFFLHNDFNHYLRIEISDSSYGMTLEQKKNLSQKITASQNKNYLFTEEFGLGLYIVNNILLQHSSFLYFKSESAIGTTFWFDIKLKY
uniref:histidine kinase n=1 Tax=Bangiopsis subsimplex TaxID=139980 RepID=A0A1C9CCM9_9RHOD|nr:hypothetical protein Bangp_035 [Bangiopsis subsimplex]AOM66117.1 hypothetical protein Bangp_035 [Bangiopsis subsimplex]ARO90325.1 conserved hypothetical plastid protein [Bangiopsis subsimplex]